MTNLGLEIISEEAELRNIIHKIPSEKGKGIMKDIHSQIMSKEGVNSSTVCDVLLQKAQLVLEKSEVMQSLTTEEIAFVREQFRSGVHTGERGLCLLGVLWWNIYIYTIVPVPTTSHTNIFLSTINQLDFTLEICMSLHTDSGKLDGTLAHCALT